MSYKEIKAGDFVKLLDLPSWLIHDLPEEEQMAMSSFIGERAIVEKVDDYGYIWLGFGKTLRTNKASLYTGHSFCITKEFVELL